MNDDTLVADIQSAIDAHKANHQAMKTASVGHAYNDVLIDAMRSALREHLHAIFKKTFQHQD